VFFKALEGQFWGSAKARFAELFSCSRGPFLVNELRCETAEKDTFSPTVTTTCAADGE